MGVPPIPPVVASKVRPLGSDGEIDHEVTGPPLAVGVVSKENSPFVKVNELGE